MRGLISATREARLPTEDLRFAVVLNGGVSLAVWMGGAVHELDRLTKARERGKDRDPYALMLSLTGCTARADVMAGTSAGGINGAALALAQVNRGADLSMLRNLWIEQGRFESLLRQPFQGDPTSLLRGDEYFLPALHSAMSRLAEAPGNRAPESAPVDLTITTTVLRGNQTVTLDSMGQQLPQTVHAGLFRWQRGAQTPAATDPFDPANIELTAHQLALASRSTASFPIAFEPSYIPVNSPEFPALAAGASRASLPEVQRLHPDMSGVVRSWGGRSANENRSRFVIDGGVLANTPTLSALQAVEAMQADGPVRRVMLLVYPHAPSPGEETPAEFVKAHTVTGALTGLLGALSAQGSRTFVDQVEGHNRRAAGRRGTRSDILQAGGPSELHSLAEQIHPHYRRLQIMRAARELAARMAGTIDDGTTSSALPDGWNYERVRSEAERAQEDWLSERGTLPYVPADLPTTADPASSWGWGVSGALGVAEAAQELLRQLVGGLSEVNKEYDAVTTARRTTFGLRDSIASMRQDVDAAWATNTGDAHDSVMGSISPNRRYWMLRLAYYDYLMIGSTTWEDVVDRIERVADFEGGLAAARVPAGSDTAAQAGAARRATVHDTLTQRLRENAERAVDETHAEPAGVVGRHLGILVDAVVAQVVRVLELLDRMPLDQGSGPYEEAGRWRRGLGLTETTTAGDLLVRLLHLEVAASALGDELSTGATQPVELVQLSAQTKNGFAEHSRTADDKLGGWSLQRFGGFLKRSWRANDWTWGRIDSATVLCRTVLHPGRIRRTARQSGYLLQGTPQELAEATVAELEEKLFGQSRADLGSLVEAAVAELEQVLDQTIDEGDLPAMLPALADLFARALHEQIVVAELPALATAIRADAVEGGHQRSRGEVFLASQASLLARLDTASSEGADPLPVTDCKRALEAFDAAGIGREPLRQESSSDMTIRTATATAAVAATMLSSSRSGLKAVSPVTKALRGLMLLPYWVVTGLTSKSGLARSLSLLGLAFGGTLLALSLFGALPEQLAGSATAMGASAVLIAFAYAALRTGTMLHGVVLLSPVIPLLTYSVIRAREQDDMSTEQGSTTLLVVVGLAAVLMLLGSFGSSYGSVGSALHRLADRRGVPREGRSTPTRWFEAVARSVWPLLLALVVVVAVGAVVALAMQPDWVELLSDWSWSAWMKWGLVVVGLVVAAMVGAVIAGRADDLPRGATAGWSVLYGAAYGVLAIVLLADPFGQHEEWWYRVALVTAALFAAALLLVMPWLLPLLESRAIRRAEQM